MIYNSDAANEYARTHVGIVYGYEDHRQNLASAYDAGWTAGRSIGDPDAEKREILRDLAVIRALGLVQPYAAHPDFDPAMSTKRGTILDTSALPVGTVVVDRDGDVVHRDASGWARGYQFEHLSDADLAQWGPLTLLVPYPMPEEQRAIAALDAITHGDPEAAHGEADKILLGLVPKPVADAWHQADARCGGFWYA